MRTRKILVWFLALCFVLLGEPVWPQFESFPRFRYPRTYRAIRRVDFANLTLHELYEGKPPRSSFPLKRGRFEQQDPSGIGSDSVQLTGVHFLDSKDDKRQRALVLFHRLSIGGSSSNTDYAQVFELVAGRLWVVQQIQWSTGANLGDQANATFDKTNVELTVRADHYLEQDANCCISAVDVVTFRWDGDRFVKKATRVELSEYGKREGKKLPQ